MPGNVAVFLAVQDQPSAIFPANPSAFIVRGCGVGIGRLKDFNGFGREARLYPGAAR
jgi:hypothetical protein